MGNKDGHCCSTRLKDRIIKKETWIILAYALYLALASTCGKLGFLLMNLVPSPEFLVYHRNRTLETNPPSHSTMVLSSR
jgi:hypothetical protein